jgi:hypothetical protein
MSRVIVRPLDELLLTGTDLQRERALSRLRQQLVRMEAQADLRSSPSRSSPQAASTIASSPRSPRLRSRVSMLPRSGSIESDGSSASSCARRRTDAVPMRIPARSCSAPHSASRGSSRGGYAPTTSRPDRSPVMSFAGVDGDVDPALEESLFELLDEDAAEADLAEGLRPVAVAGRS